MKLKSLFFITWQLGKVQYVKLYLFTLNWFPHLWTSFYKVGVQTSYPSLPYTFYRLEDLAARFISEPFQRESAGLWSYITTASVPVHLYKALFRLRPPVDLLMFVPAAPRCPPLPGGPLAAPVRSEPWPGRVRHPPLLSPLPNALWAVRSIREVRERRHLSAASKQTLASDGLRFLPLFKLAFFPLSAGFVRAFVPSLVSFYRRSPCHRRSTKKNTLGMNYLKPMVHKKFGRNTSFWPGRTEHWWEEPLSHYLGFWSGIIKRSGSTK